MTILFVASSEPRVGRSLIAAALAYRLGREGKPVTLARLQGDESADADAATFAALEYIVSPGRAITVADAASLAGDVVCEAPPGPVKQLAESLGARVVAVGRSTSPALDAPKATIAGTVLTRVPAIEAEPLSERDGVLAVLPEDALLAAPSIADIAAALEARTLVESGESGGIDLIMLGAVASDAATPYFANRRRTCVVTRFDKTDLQLAALQTDVRCLVLTGGGEPSPYLIDRVANGGTDVSVLLAPHSTVDTMRAIEGLYATSRFDGAGKLGRAVSLLDAAAFPLIL